jgi:hypothetical protein
MWGRLGKRTFAARTVETNNPVAVKWGSKTTIYLEDGLGQGNNIAVFDTWAQGICAQIELWRGPRYRNKQFAEAIDIWAGHNNVPSYIAFVKKRVPGMMESTIISDSFLNSAQGILFLKAQAWHEAGQPIPAKESDWIDAQRAVFHGAPIVAPTKPKTAVVAASTAATATAVVVSKAASSGSNWGIIVVLLVLGLLAVGGSVYWFVVRRKEIHPASTPTMVSFTSTKE